MENPWKKLDSKVVYKNPWISVREDKVIRPDGKSSIYGVVDLVNTAAYIIAINKENKFYLVRQYRYTTDEYLWEIPAGGCDNMTPLETAKTELAEELGLCAENWKKAGTIQLMNGICSEVSHVFIASELSELGSNKQEEEGIDSVKLVSFPEVFSMIGKGEITDAPSIAAITQAAITLKALNNKPN